MPIAHPDREDADLGLDLGQLVFEFASVDGFFVAGGAQHALVAFVGEYRGSGLEGCRDTGGAVAAGEEGGHFGIL